MQEVAEPNSGVTYMDSVTATPGGGAVSRDLVATGGLPVLLGHSGEDQLKSEMHREEIIFSSVPSGAWVAGGNVVSGH